MATPEAPKLHFNWPEDDIWKDFYHTLAESIAPRNVFKIDQLPKTHDLFAKLILSSEDDHFVKDDDSNNALLQEELIVLGASQDYQEEILESGTVLRFYSAHVPITLPSRVGHYVDIWLQVEHRPAAGLNVALLALKAYSNNPVEVRSSQPPEAA
jgi:hypothetical protein